MPKAFTISKAHLGVTALNNDQLNPPRGSHHNRPWKHHLAGAFACILSLVSTGYAANASSEESRYKVPFNLALGKTTFDTQCAECHGAWADGTDKGPPLIHIYYESGHHGDQAFRQAIKGGVRQHHWRFGDMPPRPAVDDSQAGAVIKYVRWLQQQNGIR